MARQCNGTAAAGKPCRRPSSKDRPYCLAHDPDRVEEHAEASQAGGVARHNSGVLSLKDEVRELMTALRKGDVSAGVGSVLLQGDPAVARA
jgi:hypothetical protein